MADVEGREEAEQAAYRLAANKQLIKYWGRNPISLDEMTLVVADLQHRISYGPTRPFKSLVNPKWETEQKEIYQNTNKNLLTLAKEHLDYLQRRHIAHTS